MWARARALNDSLRNPEDPRAIRRALVGDVWWGVAALVWLVTGLWRVIGGTEKASSYYLASNAFAIKMGLFLMIVGLEIWPSTTLMRWRRRKADPDPRDVGRIEIISYVQVALVIAMVLAAASMARGVGMRGGTTAAVSDSASGAMSALPDSAGSVRGSAAPRDSAALANVDVPETPEPSGTEAITAEDVSLLTRQITMPLDGVDPTTLRSNFDERRGGGSRQHQALDIMAPRGTPIRSATAGRVLKLFTSANGGLMVYTADSSERWVLMYAHLDRYAPGLTDSSRLQRGEVIGYVGSTGNASPTAPHLHFAIARSADVKRWSRGRPIDPLPVLVAARSATR